jgi:hypothetical protein
VYYETRQQIQRLNGGGEKINRENWMFATESFEQF